VGSKQVIVMKKFPKARNMRTGKYIAQGAHASLGALLSLDRVISADEKSLTIDISNPFVRDWLLGRFTKVTCYVETDEDLVFIHNSAKLVGIATSLITDAGLTEFAGVPTLTAVGVGPDNEELINKITGHLPLF
jgi:PTH2 family peptidyl-tRNA hydrolase